MPWVAVEPKTRTIYTALWNDCCVFKMYSVDTFAYIGDYKIADNLILPGEIQGGAFYNGDLYFCTNAKDQVWRLELESGIINLELSDSYLFHDYEMEGLDFWDLRDRGLGVMHMFGNFMQFREKSLRNYDP